MPAGVAHFLNWIYSSANVFVGAQGKLFWELLALFFLRYKQRARILFKVNKKNNNNKTKQKNMIVNIQSRYYLMKVYVCPVHTAVLVS